MANVSSSNGLEKRPKLRFPGFEEPWKDTFFSDLYEAVSEKNDGSFGVENIISVANMYFKEDARITDEEYLKTYNIFKVGDIAFEGNKSNDFSHGRFVENTIGDGIVSHVFVVFRPLHDTHNLRYWKYAINNESVMGRILARCTKKTTMMTNLVTKDFLNQTILCPSAQEQDKIANLLDGISERIKLQKLYVESLKKYKRGVISALLSSKTNPYYSSETWKEVALCDVASGFEYGMNAAATVYDGSHKYIRITDIDDNSHLYSQDVPVSPEGQVDEKYRVRENDILFARTGASVGKSYRYQRSDGDLYYAGFLIRIHVNSDVNCDYVFQNTLTEAYRRWVLLESARSGQPGINAEQYKQYRFLLPPLELQNKISTLATNLDNLICKEGNLLSQIEQVKIALLQRLFI